MYRNNDNYLNEKAQEIKSKLDIIDVISEYLPLKKAGRSYTCSCPFHKEKDASFRINQNTQLWRCFGCGSGGDIFNFLMKYKSWDFTETINELAKKAGIELEENPEKKYYGKLKEDLYKVNKDAAYFYTEYLISSPEAKTARNYLTNRKISNEIIENFDLGYSPENGNLLISYLNEKGYSNELIEKAGLIGFSENYQNYYEKFRGRIMFPIIDHQYNYIAFGGRILDETKSAQKYLNTPNTLVYNKGNVLYNINRAKDSIIEKDLAIAMEGYFDVITAYSNGITNVVGVCSTSLTTDQVNLLSKFTKSKKIYMAFDSDSAGDNGLNRGFNTLKSLSNDLNEIKVIVAPEGKDPDEYIRTRGAENYLKIIDNAPTYFEYRINTILNKTPQNASIQDKTSIIKELKPILFEITNHILLDICIDHIAKKLNLSKESIKKEINNNTKSSVYLDAALPVSDKKPHIDAQKCLLSLYFTNHKFMFKKDLKDILQGVSFTEENITLIKNELAEMVDAMSFVTEDDAEQTGDSIRVILMDEFEEKDEIKNLLIELIFLSERFSNIEENYIPDFINENIECINKYFELAKRIEEIQKGILTA